MWLDSLKVPESNKWVKAPKLQTDKHHLLHITAAAETCSTAGHLSKTVVQILSSSHTSQSCFCFALKATCKGKLRNSLNIFFQVILKLLVPTYLTFQVISEVAFNNVRNVKRERSNWLPSNSRESNSSHVVWQ